MASISGFSIKKAVSFIGSDGYGLDCDLFYKGKKIGHYHDGAYGGESDFDYEKAEDKKLLMDYLNKQPKIISDDFGMHIEMDYNIDNLVNDLYELNDFEKLFKEKDRRGNVLVIVDYKDSNNEVHKTLQYGIPKRFSDKAIKDYITDDFNKKEKPNGICDHCDIQIFRSLDDFNK